MRLVLLAALFAACNSSDSPAPVAQAAAPASAFAARATVADGRLTVFNDSATGWTNTLATLDNTVLCNLGVVHPSDQSGMNLSNCTGALPATLTSVRVVADQGQATILLDPPVSLGAVAATPATPTTTTTTTTTTVATSTPAATPQSAPTEAFSAGGSVTGGFGPARRVHVINKNSYTWTGCTVTVNGDYTWPLKDMPPGLDEGIMLGRFKDGNGNPLTGNVNISSLKVRCNQGSDSVSL